MEYAAVLEDGYTVSFTSEKIAAAWLAQHVADYLQPGSEVPALRTLLAREQIALELELAAIVPEGEKTDRTWRAVDEDGNVYFTFTVSA